MRKGSFKKEDVREKVEELKGLVSEVTPDDMLKFSQSWVLGKMTYPDAKSYSLFNYVIANKQMQRRGFSGITVIAPFSTWKEKERNVKKGQKALKVLAPKLSKFWIDSKGNYHYISRKNPAPKDEAVLNDCVGYFPVSVFDYAQTEGKELEGIRKIKGGLEGIWSEGSCEFSLDHIISVSGIPSNFYEVSSDGSAGFTTGFSISLLDKRDEPGKERDMISTYIHEWAHTLLHYNADRKSLSKGVKETEAETVAYVVCSMLGFKSLAAPIYVKSWSGKTKQKPRTEKVLKAVETILNNIFLSKEGSRSFVRSA